MFNLAVRLSLIVLLLVAPAAVGRVTGKPGAEIMLSRLPAAAQKTIHAQLGDGQLESIEKNTENGELTYEVEMTKGGKTRGFTVGAGGELIDQQVFLPELPTNVQKTIQTQVGPSTLGDIYRSTENDGVVYDVEMTGAGKTRSFTVGSGGELESVEVFMAELPPAVQQTIRKQVGGGSLEEINKSTEDDEVSYDVEMTAGGKSRGFTVGSKGELLDVEVFLNELPATLQKSIQTNAGAGQVGEIDKSVEDGEVSYDVEVTAGGKSSTLSFDSASNLLSREDPINLSDAPKPVQEKVRSLMGDGKLTGISKITEGKVISYAVDLKQAGKQKSYNLGPDGTLLPEEE
jgi:uncharacterized membrane protein YkoI